MADPSPTNRNLAGVLLMSAAVLLFSLNDVLGKWLVATYSVAQLLALRSLAALAVLAPVVASPRRGGLERLLRPKRPGLQIARVAFGTLEVGAFYWAVSLMPLADAMAFWMATPILVALASALLLGERLGAARMGAVGLGFVGVAMALGAGFGGDGWLPTLVAAAGACLYAGYLIATRALRGSASAGALAFYQMAGALLFGLLALPFAGWATPTALDLSLLLLLGLVGTGAHLMVTRSLHLAPAAVVVPWQYAMILWGILFGWAVFGEVPSALMLAGVAVIVAAGLWLTRLDLRRGGGSG